MKEIKLTDYLELVFKTNDEHINWFGYYNYDPLNYNQTKMLCNRAQKDGVAPEKGDVIELGYYDIPSGEWHYIGESDSWNWQQGAMIQWIPGKGNEKSVIYNTSKNGRLISIIKDVEKGETRELNWPIYVVTPDGKKSIAVDLERSYWCRAYHYQSVANQELEGNIIESDGIFEVDLQNNTRKRIVSIRDVLNLEPIPEFPKLKHWFEHIMINQDGTKFCFLHRFSPEYNVNAYQTRLLVADIDGSNLQIISGWDKVDWSHFGWNKNDFAIYTVPNNGMGMIYKTMGNNASKEFNLKTFAFKCASILVHMLPASVRKKMKGGKSYYQYYTLQDDGKYALTKLIEKPYLNIDGHPSFTNDGKYMVTDTYPDEHNYQHLIIHNIETGNGVVVADLYAYYNHTPATCDLHPKLSKNNNYVVVDSAFNDKHHMVMFKIDWDRIESLLG